MEGKEFLIHSFVEIDVNQLNKLLPYLMGWSHLFLAAKQQPCLFDFSFMGSSPSRDAVNAARGRKDSTNGDEIRPRGSVASRSEEIRQVWLLDAVVLERRYQEAIAKEKAIKRGSTSISVCAIFIISRSSC